jgi:hypothetical protein
MLLLARLAVKGAGAYESARAAAADRSPQAHDRPLAGGANGLEATPLEGLPQAHVVGRLEHVGLG